MQRVAVMVYPKALEGYLCFTSTSCPSCRGMTVVCMRWLTSGGMYSSSFTGKTKSLSIAHRVQKITPTNIPIGKAALAKRMSLIPVIFLLKLARNATEKKIKVVRCVKKKILKDIMKWDTKKLKRLAIAILQVSWLLDISINT